MELVILANETMEDARALVNLENQEVLLSGDEYHDKISAKIKGFIEGLNVAGAKYKVVKEGVLVDEENEEFYNSVLYIQPSHPWFTLVGFFEED